jgi:hypothetical protein
MSLDVTFKFDLGERVVATIGKQSLSGVVAECIWAQPGFATYLLHLIDQIGRACAVYCLETELTKDGADGD